MKTKKTKKPKTVWVLYDDSGVYCVCKTREIANKQMVEFIQYKYAVDEKSQIHLTSATYIKEV